jgi:hypothetical protein
MCKQRECDGKLGSQAKKGAVKAKTKVISGLEKVVLHAKIRAMRASKKQLLK